MARPYKTNSGRIIMRKSNGRFRKATLKDLGIKVNSEYYVCEDCGYGEHDYRVNERWLPLIEPDKCPKCKSVNIKPKEIKLTERYLELKKELDENTRGTIYPTWMRNRYQQLNWDMEIEYKKSINQSFEIPNTLKDKIDAEIEQELNI